MIRYQVRVSFWVETQEDKNGDPDLIEAFVRNRLGRMQDLDVTIRKIGAGGETSEHEGTVGLTEEDVPTVRGVENVQTEGGAL